jgi:hypothetical protein
MCLFAQASSLLDDAYDPRPVLRSALELEPDSMDPFDVLRDICQHRIEHNIRASGTADIEAAHGTIITKDNPFRFSYPLLTSLPRIRFKELVDLCEAKIQLRAAPSQAYRWYCSLADRVRKDFRVAEEARLMLATQMTLCDATLTEIFSHVG